MHPNYNQAPSPTERFFLPKSLDRASARDRFVACVIDVIILSVISSFLIGAFGAIGTYVSIGLYHLYFIVSHKLFSKTVGKQAMGIFLASRDSEGITWRQIIMRETVWKWMSAAPLMYGFLRIYFLNESMHDKYAKTTVLTEKKAEMSFIKAALITGSMLLIFGSSIYYCVMQTSLLGHYVVKRMTEKGHVIRGLSGNPKKGWRVEYWRGQTPQGTFEFKDVSFLYDLGQLYSKGTLHIKEIRVGRALYLMNSLPPFLQKQRAEPNLPQVNYYVPQDEETIKKFIIDNINFSNIKIVRKGEEDVDVTRFYVKNLVVDNQEGSLDQAYIDAPSIQFQVWKSNIDFTTGKMNVKTEFQLRRGLHRSILRTINGKVEFVGTVAQPRIIRGTAFDGRLELNYQNNHFWLTAKKLTPSYFIRYDTNIASFSAEMRNPMCSGLACLTGGSSRGSFYHNGKKFAFKGTDVWPEDKRDEIMKLQLTSLWMNAISKSPIFSVSTDQELPDFIADVYFSKPYQVLTPEERKNIDVVRKDFFKYANRNVTSEKGGLPSREDFNSR